MHYDSFKHFLSRLYFSFQRNSELQIELILGEEQIICIFFSPSWEMMTIICVGSSKIGCVSTESWMHLHLSCDTGTQSSKMGMQDQERTVPCWEGSAWRLRSNVWRRGCNSVSQSLRTGDEAWSILEQHGQPGSADRHCQLRRWWPSY